MLTLTPDQARVLGVLIEKATTTPDQYPLSLNAVVNGANQKNNRHPILTLDENRAFEALEALRAAGLVVRVDTAGSRVNKYRHQAGEALHVRPGELAILAELLLRGPQTLGELRGRASRMHPLDTLDVAREMLRALMTRDEPLARELPPDPGSRAERYAQLLCPDCHPTDAPAPASASAPPRADDSRQDAGAASSSPSTGDRLTKLEAEVVALRQALRALATAVGEADPFPDAVREP